MLGRSIVPRHKGTSVRRHGDKPEELERQLRARPSVYGRRS